MTATERRAIGVKPSYVFAQITAKGLDYLSSDGGLGAELGVVTIKLHPETLAALIEQRIGADRLPEAERSRLSKALRSLSSKAMESLVKKLVERGLDHTPDAIQWLRTVLDQLQR